MGAKRKEKKLKTMTMNLSADMKTWSAQITGETPTPQIHITISREFGWCSGRLKWFSVVTKDGEIAQKQPHDTEPSAKAEAISFCAMAEYHNVRYTTDIKLGDSPKRQEK